MLIRVLWYFYELYRVVFYKSLRLVGFSALPYNSPKNGVILITGASTGIGAHAAHHLSEKGFTVFAGVRRTEDARNLKDAAKTKRLIPIIIDVTDEETIKKAYQVIEKKLIEDNLPFIALVNNAGISIGGPVEFLHQRNDIDQLFDVNVWGAIRVTQKFLSMIRTYRGRIINIGSIAGEITQPFSGLYSASKRALEGFNDALRSELFHDGISVSLVEPGAIKTDIWAKPALRPLPAHATPSYQKIYSSRMSQRGKSYAHAASPSVTSNIIEHAIVSRCPHTKYMAGTDAIILHYLRMIIGDRLADFIQIKLIR